MKWPTAAALCLLLALPAATAFGQQTIHDGLDLDIRPGEVLGIVGGSGTGKSVLLRTIIGLKRPEGGRIEVQAAPEDGSVEVSVTDTGVGIAPEDGEAVFKEFRQVGTAEKRVEGTGLGLTLCRKFVELHGGRIWVKSELGKGSNELILILQ